MKMYEDMDLTEEEFMNKRTGKFDFIFFEGPLLLYS